MERSYSTVTPAQLALIKREAYQPDECDQCASIGGVCWECYEARVVEFVEAG